MSIRTGSAYVALLLAASPGAAEIPSHGRYACVLGTQGSCSGDGPEAICLGARLRLAKPNVFLGLDFDRNRAELNGIEGAIHRNSETNTVFIHWDDLALLGSPTITMNRIGGGLDAGLRFQGQTAEFVCREIGPDRD